MVGYSPGYSSINPTSDEATLVILLNAGISLYMMRWDGDTCVRPTTETESNGTYCVAKSRSSVSVSANSPVDRSPSLTTFLPEFLTFIISHYVICAAFVPGLLCYTFQLNFV